MKQIISILIIVAALAGAGVFAYMIFFSGPSAGIESLSVSGKSASSDILPLGSNLNFEQIRNYNKDMRLFQYPAVNPAEIGPAMNTIIKQ